MNKHLSLEQLNKVVDSAAQYVLDYAKTEGNGIEPNELSTVRFAVALMKTHIRDLVNEEMTNEYRMKVLRENATGGMYRQSREG